MYAAFEYGLPGTAKTKLGFDAATVEEVAVEVRVSYEAKGGEVVAFDPDPEHDAGDMAIAYRGDLVLIAIEAVR